MKSAAGCEIRQPIADKSLWYSVSLHWIANELAIVYAITADTVKSLHCLSVYYFDCCQFRVFLIQSIIVIWHYSLTALTTCRIIVKSDDK